MHALQTLSSLNEQAVLNSFPKYRYSRDRNFKRGDRVRSFDFPGAHRDCYIDGYVREVRRDHTVVIDVYSDVRQGVESIDLPSARHQVVAPTGRGIFFGKHAVFKLIDREAA